jgi:hypothetical protein
VNDRFRPTAKAPPACRPPLDDVLVDGAPNVLVAVG